MARPRVRRRVARVDPAARRARTCDHLRAHGRHQHGPRRAHHGGRVHDLRCSEPLPRARSRRLRLVSRRRGPGRVHRPGARRDGARPRRDPLALRPAARDAARHLGHQIDPHAGGAHDLRRAERPGREPGVHVGRHPGAGERRSALEPHRDHLLRCGSARGDVADAHAHAAGAVRPRGDAEPRDGGLRRCAHDARRHARLRAGVGHRRPRRLRAVADRQRRSRPGPGLHRRLVHGGRVRRRRPARGNGLRSARARLREQAPRVLVGSGDREDRGPRLHHRVHPTATARAVRPEGSRGGGLEVAPVATTLARLYGPKGWLALGAAAAMLFVVFPVLSLAVPQSSAFHLSQYWVTLAGKIMCYAIVALAMDLIWGYTGILSLGHGLFFALGGYAMGMYLMRQIGREGQYQADLPDFMVFLDWKELPWHWWNMDQFWWAALLVVLVPGVLAFVFGFFAFRSRVKGVYFSIITQALTFAAMLLFFRNETGFGGNNGFTDFKRVLGIPVTTPQMRVTLFAISGCVLVLFYLMARAIVNSKYGRVLQAIRDAESRVMFSGYNPVAYKLSIWTLSAVMCAIAGALYVPQVGIINPSEMSPAASIEIAIWTAVGGRATLIGPIVGAFFVNGAKSWFTAAFPELWLYFLGALFIAVTLFLPNGLIGLLRSRKKEVRT